MSAKLRRVVIGEVPEWVPDERFLASLARIFRDDAERKEPSVAEFCFYQKARRRPGSRCAAKRSAAVRDPFRDVSDRYCGISEGVEDADAVRPLTRRGRPRRRRGAGCGGRAP